MLSLCPLASGSKGNAVFVKNDTASFLIDCGLSVKETKKRLSLINRSLDDIEFILITHEHSDHIRAAEELSIVYGIPLIAYSSTLRNVTKSFALKNGACFSSFNGFCQNGIEITPFKNSHDVFTVGYSIKDGESHIVYSTDLGCLSPSLFDLASGADTVMIESNYDPDMLKNGKYPPFLKRRILSELGHLSNTDCAATVYKLAKSGTKNFVLGHLSQENNTPDIALSKTLQLVDDQRIRIDIASQHEVGEFI